MTKKSKREKLNFYYMYINNKRKINIKYKVYSTYIKITLL